VAPVLGTLGADGTGADGVGNVGVGTLGALGAPGAGGSLSGSGSVMPSLSSRRLRSLSTSPRPSSIALRRRSIARLRSSSLSSFF